MAAPARSTLLPSPQPAAGQPLWGGPPRRQPIVPLIALAFITLLVAAPTAFSSAGAGSSNPIDLMHRIAASTYEMTGVLDQTNTLLSRIDGNTKPLGDLNDTMGAIAASSKGMDQKTQALNEKLAGVGASVANSRSGLKVVDGKLAKTAAGMVVKRRAVNSSLTATRRIVGDFRVINTSIGGMDSSLVAVIRLMDTSAPATKAFANNRTVRSVSGGDGHKYNAPNIVAGSRVMSVVLPMIDTLQKGGPMIARKDSHRASNVLIDFALKRSVPDGVNVVSIIRSYDGLYGMPGREYFVNNRVGGF